MNVISEISEISFMSYHDMRQTEHQHTYKYFADRLLIQIEIFSYTMNVVLPKSVKFDLGQKIFKHFHHLQSP